MTIELSPEAAQFINSVVSQLSIKPADPNAAKTVELVHEIIKATTVADGTNL